jgi:hypothetical protein
LALATSLAMPRLKKIPASRLPTCWVEECITFVLEVGYPVYMRMMTFEDTQLSSRLVGVGGIEAIYRTGRMVSRTVFINLFTERASIS